MEKINNSLLDIWHEESNAGLIAGTQIIERAYVLRTRRILGANNKVLKAK